MSGKTIWDEKLAEKDFDAARVYLGLVMPPRQVAEAVKMLRAAPTVDFAAKDLLRASQTHLLGENDPQVAEHLRKIKKGKKIPPVLLVRGDALRGVTLIIADGHHRICASYHWADDQPVACRLAAIGRSRARSDA